MQHIPYAKLLARSEELIEQLSEEMERNPNMTADYKVAYNAHEYSEFGRYYAAQVKALIREQDLGSPFLLLCAEEDKACENDTWQLYQQYIRILHAFNKHLEAFIN